eukprot:8482373-Lingulodinium_polyedra.AAC.1
MLLPKPGADPAEALDRRPIWLLPVLYRIWAAGRAQDWSQWAAVWGGQPSPRGAAEPAWELAMELDTAEVAGQAVAGAVLDWRKVFDNVPLGRVEEALRRARVPGWVA